MVAGQWNDLYTVLQNPCPRWPFQSCPEGPHQVCVGCCMVCHSLSWSHPTISAYHIVMNCMLENLEPRQQWQTEWNREICSTRSASGFPQQRAATMLCNPPSQTTCISSKLNLPIYTHQCFTQRMGTGDFQPLSWSSLSQEHHVPYFRVDMPFMCWGEYWHISRTKTLTYSQLHRRKTWGLVW